MAFKKGNCKNCNKKFNYEKSSSKGIFCSYKCYWNFKKGNAPWNKGLKLGRQTPYKKSVCKGCSEEFEHTPSKKRTFCSKLCQYRAFRQMATNHIPWNKGKKVSKKVREEMSIRMKGRFSGNKHPNWQGGKSFEPYGIEFNKSLKEEIRKRDDFTCQLCFILQEELNYKLVVHHKDCNKLNNSKENLIALCRPCHMKIHWVINKQNNLNKEVLVSSRQII